MAFMNLRNFVVTASRFKLNQCFVRLYNQHPNCNDVIGNREWVCYGKNSEPNYIDHPGIPFPAVRFKEDNKQLIALREREKGDWRNLTIVEKKTLYRASFCQTYAEFMAPTGVWKSIIGAVLFCISLGIWLFLYLRWLYSTELPDSFLESNQKAQLERMLALEVNPIHGLASKWDYERECWK